LSVFDPYGLNATTEYLFASGGFGAAFEFVDSILEQIEQGEDDIDLLKATIAAGKGAAIGFGTGIFGSFFTGTRLTAIALRHAGLFTVTGGAIGGTIRFEIWVIGGGPP